MIFIAYSLIVIRKFFQAFSSPDVYIVLVISKSKIGRFPDRWLLMVLLLAVIVRVAYVLTYSDLPDWDLLTVDNYYHHHWAQSIAGGNIFGDTTYFRAPLYIYCLALLYYVLGSSLWIGRVFGLLTGLVSIVLTYFLGKRIANRKIGIIAAAIQSVYPITLYFEAELLLDSLFTVLLQAAVFLWLRWMDNRKATNVIIIGVVLGLAAITRPTALVIAVPIAASILFNAGTWSTRVRQIVLLVLGLSISVGPIFLRNLIVADDPVLISSQAGVNLYIGNNDQADGVWARFPEPMGHNWRLREVTHIAESEAGQPLKPSEVSSYWTNEALDWVTSNPVSFASLYWKKLCYSMSNWEISNNRDLGKFFSKVPMLRYNPLTFGIIFAFAILGIAIGKGNRKHMKLLAVTILLYTATIALFFFNSRFRVPLMPFYIILAVAGGAGAFSEFQRSRKRGVVILLSIIALSLFTRSSIVTPPKSVAPLDLISRGLYHYANNDHEQALHTFRQALIVDSTFPEVNLNTGVCFLRLGKVDSAYYYFNRERTFNPQRPKTYINLASLYLIDEQFDAATRETERALAIMPYDVTANIVLLRAVSGNQNISNDSLVSLTMVAASRTGDDLYLLNDAAILLTHRGELTQAKAILQRALNSYPPPIETDDQAFERNFRNDPVNRKMELAQTYYQLGYLAGLSGHYREAINHSKQAIKRDSLLVEAYVNLVSGYISIGQATLADSVLETANKRFPTNSLIDRLLEYRPK